MRAHPLGRDAAVIGEVIADEQRFVQMTTRSAAAASSTGLRASNCRGFADAVFKFAVRSVVRPDLIVDTVSREGRNRIG